MELNRPSVSLIISTYNWPQALKLALKSIALQTILPTEVIVADDGSKEETRLLIESLQKDFPCPLIHVWHEDTGFRLSVIRNKSIAIAKGEYILQIDGDIILEKHYVSDHLDMAKKGLFASGSRVRLLTQITEQVLKEELVTLCLDPTRMNSLFNGLRNKMLRKYYHLRYKANYRPVYVRGCNMAFWRADLVAVNGYNETIEGWGVEDIELSTRLIMNGLVRQFIKFGAVQFHIDHPLSSRDSEAKNYEILAKTEASGNVRCEKGLDQYL